MTEPSLDANQARADLYEVMQQDVPFEEKATQALELGADYLDVDNGHLTRIDKQTDFWEAIASSDPPDGTFPAGLVLDFKTTYCRRVLARDSSIALHDAPEQGWADDPAFEAHGLHCYHGTPLSVADEIYGTVCFVSETPRDEPFDAVETTFAEFIARMLEYEWEHSMEKTELRLQAGLINVLSRVLRHNIRNDLNVARGHLTRLVDEMPGASQVGEIAIRKIDGIVKLSETARRLESIAESDDASRPVELKSLVQQIVEGARRTHGTAAFHIEGPKEVPIKAMPSLRTALAELVENGAKHAGEEPTVTVSIDDTDDSVRIQVRDNGPGLPKQEQAVLDEGTETPLVHGSGLGLWMTYWIVANHGGSMETEVTEDGTVVTVTLPRSTAPADIAGHEVPTQRFRLEQERFQAVFEQSVDGMVIADNDRRFVEVNDAAADLFGLPKEDLLGRPIDEFVPSGFDIEATWEEFRTAGTVQGTFQRCRPDGTERTVELTATADVVQGQHLGVLRDITERVERQRRYEALSKGFPDLCFIMGADGVYRDVLASPASEDQLYTDPEDFLGRHVSEVLPGDVAHRLQETIEQTIETGDARTVHYELRMGDETRAFQARMTPLSEPPDGGRMVSMVVRDITDLPGGDELDAAVSD